MYNGNIKQGLLIFLASSFLFLSAGEILIRATLSNPRLSDRFLMWSSPLYQLEEDGAVHYLPNLSVREVAMYDRSIEYDINFVTNNLGLVDTENYPENLQGQKAIAIVGDSFTSGAGGYPWIADARDHLRDRGVEVPLYNFGISGTGIAHFQKILQHFSPRLHFDRIVIAAISDDFHRLYWYPMTSNSAIRFCPDGESREVCRKRLPGAHVIPSSADRQQLTEIFDSLKFDQERYEADDNPDSRRILWKRLGEFSRIVKLLDLYWHSEPLFAVGERKQEVSEGLLYFVRKMSLESLEQIVRDFPNKRIDLFHIPEKGEVQTGEYRLDLREMVRHLPVQYFPALNECHWERDMYHRRDDHPNRKGYENMRDCLVRFIRDSA